MDAKQQALAGMLSPPLPARNPQAPGNPQWRNDPAYATPASAYVAGQAIGPVVPGAARYTAWFNARQHEAEGNQPDQIAHSYDYANKIYSAEPTERDRKVAQEIYYNMGPGQTSALAAIGWRDPSIWNISPLEQDEVYTSASGAFSPPRDEEGRNLPAYKGRGFVNNMRTNPEEDVSKTTPMHEGMHAGIATLKADPRFRDAVIKILEMANWDRGSEGAISDGSHDSLEHGFIDPMTNTMAGQQWNFGDQRNKALNKEEFMKRAAAGSEFLHKDENGKWTWKWSNRPGYWKTNTANSQQAAADLEHLAQQYLATVQKGGPR